MSYNNIFQSKLPAELLELSCFCLWRLEEGKKIPYICKNKDFKNNLHSNNLRRGLKKDHRLYFSYQEALQWYQFDNTFQIGFYLFERDFFVINIYNCPNLQDSVEFVELKTKFSFTYIEISPSGCGCHLIGLGRFLHSQNKSSKRFCNGASLETYDGKDNRFFTITENAIQQNILDVSHTIREESMKWLRDKYFSPKVIDKKEVKVSLPLDNQGDNTIQRIAHNEGLIQKMFQALRKDIISYNKKQFFSYRSGKKSDVSVSDFSFVMFIANFIEENNPYAEDLLLEFLLLERPRKKLTDRLNTNSDYARLTVRNAIIKAKQMQSMGQFVGQFLDTKTIVKHKCQTVVSSKDMLKVCDLQHYYFLDSTLSLKDTNNLTFYRNRRACNSLKVSMTGGLLQARDLVIFIEILKQYESAKSLFGYDSNASLVLDIVAIALQVRNNTNSSTRSFIKKSLEKMSYTHLSYSKVLTDQQISPKMYTLASNLLTLDTIKRGSKAVISVQLNKIFTISSDDFNYNYALLNLPVFESLPTFKFKLLYYYFSLQVLPGSSKNFSVKYLISDLYFNSDYQDSKKRKHIAHRLRKTLIELYDLRHTLTDFDLKLEFKNSCVVGIFVKRSRYSIT